MPLFNFLFNQTITGIYRATSDGYGAKQETYLYKNIPCRFVEVNALSYSANLIKENYKGTFFIDPKYDDISLEDVIVCDSREYIIKSINYVRPLIGPLQFIQIMVIDHA